MLMCRGGAFIWHMPYPDIQHADKIPSHTVIDCVARHWLITSQNVKFLNGNYAIPQVFGKCNHCLYQFKPI